MAQPLVKKDDDRDDEAQIGTIHVNVELHWFTADYSPFLGIEKGAVLQEARVFNDPQLDPRRCSQVITKLLYLLNQGETFTKTEATEVFFSVTKLFQSRDIGLRRMVYLMIKELSPSADEVIIVTSSLMKDMTSKTDMYRANAIRVLCRITEGTLLTQIERYLKQAIVDKNPVVASAALVSGIHLLQTNPEIVKRWSNEVQEAVQSRAALVQFHALGLLHQRSKGVHGHSNLQIRQNDRLAVSKLVTSLTRGTVRSPLAQCLLIRYTSQVIRESAASTQAGDRPFYDFLEGCLRHKAEMVIFEAARAITELSGVTTRELTPAITVLQLFLSSSKPVLRFAAVRTLNKVAMTHPMAVTNCNIDMESLISDQNRSIATLAITTLLKTGNESSVDRLMKQITNFMSDIADEFKIVVVEAIRSLCLKFPLKYRSLWALGVLIYLMLHGEMPFGSWRESELDTFAKVAKGRLNLPETFSPDAVDLLTKLLEVDENTRLGSQGPESVKCHPWFDGIDWKGIMDRTFPVPHEITSRISQHLESHSEDYSSTLVSSFQNVEEFNIPEWLDDW
ncbi:Coatomer subunit gamma [Morella rubra]|uniref:Coatomer subunit gamma n=1 Tax=Morella rubra TaxID=262757 RepID=A0A6A1WJ23_9ROSI|nr:Coatomer subunit gamma [Morella rubra]